MLPFASCASCEEANLKGASFAVKVVACRAAKPNLAGSINQKKIITFITQPFSPPFLFIYFYLSPRKSVCQSYPCFVYITLTSACVAYGSRQRQDCLGFFSVTLGTETTLISVYWHVVGQEDAVLFRELFFFSSPDLTFRLHRRVPEVKPARVVCRRRR